MPRAFILDANSALVIGKHGYFLVNRNDFYIGKSIEIYGEHGEIESVFLQSLVKEGDNVIEGGANIGAHTISLAKAVGQQGRIFAFEPQHACYALLQAQIALNQLGNIHAFNEGVGRIRGQLWMPMIDYAQLGTFGGVAMSNEKTSGAEAVDVITLDEKLGDTSCALLKIDVEGMEEEVIQGGLNLIKGQRPLLLPAAAAMSPLVGAAAGSRRAAPRWPAHRPSRAW